LIQQLGAEEFAVRERAYASLAALGTAANEGLKQAENHPNAETRQRVHDLRQRIETKAEPNVQAAAARLLARAKPAGAAEVLLAYLPFAGEPAVVDELCKTLGTVAVRGGTVEPVIVKALSDTSP